MKTLIFALLLQAAAPTNGWVQKTSDQFTLDTLYKNGEVCGTAYHSAGAKQWNALLDHSFMTEQEFKGGASRLLALSDTEAAAKRQVEIACGVRTKWDGKFHHRADK